MQRGFPAAVLFDAFNDIVSLLPEPVHLDQLFRRMLQITVHDSRAFSLSLRKARKNSRFLAEVSRKPDTADSGVPRCGSADFIPCPVFGAVADKDNFEWDSGRIQNRRDHFCGLKQGRLLVICGKHNGKKAGALFCRSCRILTHTFTP